MGTWIPVVVAVLSAVLSGYYAKKSRAAELQAERILDLERRLAAAKTEVFEPIVDAFGRLFDLTAEGKGGDADGFEKAAGPQFRKFVQWVQVYGSDDSVRMVHKLMQALYANPPLEVVLRMTGDLILTARRELGHPDTALNSADLLGIRLKELYTGDPQQLEALTLPEAEAFEMLGWTPPWGDRFDGEPSSNR